MWESSARSEGVYPRSRLGFVLSLVMADWELECEFPFWRVSPV
jgi:hypothetical protein